MANKAEGVLDDVRKLSSSNAVLVFSKTWCPYCTTVKNLFSKLGVTFELIELDRVPNGKEVQGALKKLTGQSTVPSVFIGGKHIGGCDNTMALHKKGGLLPALESAGAKIAAS